MSSVLNSYITTWLGTRVWVTLAGPVVRRNVFFELGLWQAQLCAGIFLSELCLWQAQFCAGPLSFELGLWQAQFCVFFV